jgi:cell cycle checkpoint control protein RAD9A
MVEFDQYGTIHSSTNNGVNPGVLKTYRLTFEAVPPLHALFSRESANNTWSISSRTLREFAEHFGPGTEQLDIYSADGRVSLTSFTEKIMSGTGRFKSPNSG